MVLKFDYFQVKPIFKYNNFLQQSISLKNVMNLQYPMSNNPEWSQRSLNSDE